MKRIIRSSVPFIIAGTMLTGVSFGQVDTDTTTDGSTNITEPSEEEKVEADRIKTLKERGMSAGKSEAEALAQRHAEKHFFSDQTADPTREGLKSDIDIIAKYYLHFQEPEYRDAFLEKFKEYYPTAYNEEFIRLERENEDKLYERAKTDGIDIGTKVGSTRAVMDFVEGKTNSWKRAYDEFIAEKSLDKRYYLYNEPSWYGPIFKDWFKAYFNGIYTATYMDSNMASATGNILYRKLSGLGDVVTFQDHKVDVTDGELQSSRVKTVELSIPKAAFYNDTYIGIQKEKNTFGKNAGGYEPVTDIYTVTVNNSNDNVKLREDITLTFDYFGSERVGIYEWKNGSWKYITTLQDEQKEDQLEGLVSAVIPKGVDYGGGQYALFIDEGFNQFTDIQMSWAREEIFNYLRRAYIFGYGDNTFRPERNITRAEFLTISGRVLNWNVSNSRETISFNDRDSFGIYEDVINYASSKNYIYGYPDGSFKPDEHITYREIEWLMGRITMTDPFKWSYFSDIMKYDKFKYSPSNDSMDKKIMRDEAVFMYYTLEKEGKI